MRGDNTDERTTEAVRGDEPSAEDVPSPDRLAVYFSPRGTGNIYHQNVTDNHFDDSKCRSRQISSSYERFTTCIQNRNYSSSLDPCRGRNLKRYERTAPGRR